VIRFENRRPAEAAAPGPGADPPDAAPVAVEVELSVEAARRLEALPPVGALPDRQRGARLRAARTSHGGFLRHERQGVNRALRWPWPIGCRSVPAARW
jgi:hypothetical protein